MSNSSIWSINWAVSRASIPGQNGTGSDGNEGVLNILLSSSITRASLSYCLVPYPRHSLGEVLRLCKDTVIVFYTEGDETKEREICWVYILERERGRRVLCFSLFNGMSTPNSRFNVEIIIIICLLLIIRWYIYRQPQTDLFCSIRTLQCGETG